MRRNRRRHVINVTDDFFRVTLQFIVESATRILSLKILIKGAQGLTEVGAKALRTEVVYILLNVLYIGD